MKMKLMNEYYTWTVDRTVDFVLIDGEGVLKPCMILTVLAEEGFRDFLWLERIMGDEGCFSVSSTCLTSFFDGVICRS